MPTPTTVSAAEPKPTTANIVKGVMNKSQGKATPVTNPIGKGPEIPEDGDEKGKVDAADPNAGKEKYTVEGQDRWLTPAEARAYVQKGIAFEPRISELARMKQEIQRFEQALVSNPGMIIANIAKQKGVPIADLVNNVLSSNASDEVKEATGKWYWENVAKRHQMDPKDREIFEKDERIKTLEEQDKQKADAAIAYENRQRVAKALAEVSAQIQETLKELGIKNVDSAAAVRLTREIADVMRIGMVNGKPVTAKQAAEKVKARILEYQREFYDDLDMDQLVEALGKANAEKVRKFFLKTVQDAEKGTAQDAGRPSGTIPKRDTRKTINMDEFHDYLDDLKKTSK